VILWVTCAWADDYGFRAGEVVWAAGDGVKVRSEPSSSAPIVAKLHVGDPIAVVSIGPEELVGEARLPWLQTATGWVWAGTTTRVRAEADLDADGRPERITAGMSTKGRWTLRVWSPAGPGDGVAWVDLPERSDMGGVQPVAGVSAQLAVGVPLIEVYWPGAEMCGGYEHRNWYAWSGGKLVAAPFDGWSGADAPVFSNATLAFAPGKATRTTIDGESTDEGEVGTQKVQTWTWSGGAWTAGAQVETPWKGKG
jgi:hypothetical protein